MTDVLEAVAPVFNVLEAIAPVFNVLEAVAPVFNMLEAIAPVFNVLKAIAPVFDCVSFFHGRRVDRIVVVGSGNAFNSTRFPHQARGEWRR